MEIITSGVVIRALWTQKELLEPHLLIEFKSTGPRYNGFCYSLEFNEVDSYKILSNFDKNPGKKDPNKMVGEEMVLLEHPAGGTLAPIAVKINPEDTKWIYKKEGDWCRWM